MNNYLPSDILSSVARLFLLFQILTVFSLFSFLIRMQVLGGLLGVDNPKFVTSSHSFINAGTFRKRWVLVLNVGILIICVLFAVFLPTVGNILRCEVLLYQVFSSTKLFQIHRFVHRISLHVHPSLRCLSEKAAIGGHSFNVYYRSAFDYCTVGTRQLYRSISHLLNGVIRFASGSLLC